MKWLLPFFVIVCLMMGCVKNTNDDKVPSLETFHTQELPSGGSDAALTAAKI